MYQFKKWQKIVLIIIASAAFAYYLKYRFTPMRIYPLDPEKLWDLRKNRRQLKSGGYINPPIYDTSISKAYVIEGYLSDDTADIKNAILPFLKAHSGVDLHSKTIRYGFSFFKANRKVDKSFEYDASEYSYNGDDLDDCKIADVEIWDGKSSITYYHNKETIYLEFTLNDSTIVRYKYKGDCALYKDTYTPKGVIHEDLTEMWNIQRKEMGK